MWRIWVAALLWGLNWPIIKVLLTGASPWTLRAAGLTCGATLLAFATVAAGQSLKVPRKHWGNLIIAALLNVAAFNVLSVFAQMTMTASRAAIITYTMPLWSVLFAWIVLAEPIDKLRSVALVLGAAGITLLAVPFWDVIRAGGVPFGLIYVMTSAIAWAAGTVFIKATKPEGSLMGLTAWQFIIGAVAVTIGMVIFERPHLELNRPEILAAFLYSNVLAQAVAYTLWFGLMARVPASTAALGTLLVPIFAVISSSVWLGERLSPLDLSGFALILLGVLLDQGLRAWLARPTQSGAPQSQPETTS